MDSRRLGCADEQEDPGGDQDGEQDDPEHDEPPGQPSLFSDFSVNVDAVEAAVKAAADLAAAEERWLAVSEELGGA